MANMVEGGKTPIINAAGLQELGFSFVIFPGGIVRAIAATARDYYANLLSSGSNEAFRNRMFDFAGLNGVIGTDDLLASGKRYDGDTDA
jgi:2-methylisocitrate lyase-like PEP mutase family enzyme